MKLPKSKLGIIFAAVYILITILVFLYAKFACSTDALYCGTLGFMPLFPTILLTLSFNIFFVGASPDIVSYLEIAIALLINVILFYFIGSAIQNKFSQKTIKIITVLALSVAVIIIIVLGIRYFNKSDIFKPNIPTNVNNPINSRDYCQQDSDCVLAPQYQGCCTKGCEIEAVNIKSQDRDKEARNKQYYCNLKDFKCPQHKCVSSVYNQAVCEQNRCVVKEKQTVNINTNDNITISLNKTYYQKGETVSMAIRNNGNNKIFITNIAVEKYLSNQDEAGFNKWEIIDRDIESPCYALDDKLLITISADSSETFSWQQDTDKLQGGIGGQNGLICAKADLGKYRFQIDYYEDDVKTGKTQLIETIYSNEFEIGLIQPTLNNYKIIGSYISPGESSFVKVLGDTVFLTDISEGLLAIDVSNPEKPVLLDKIKIGNSGAYALAIEPNGPFVIVGGYGNPKVALVNVRDPKNLQIISEIDVKRSVQDMVVVGNYAYLAIDGPEIEVLELTQKFDDSLNPLAELSISRLLTSKGVFQIQGGGHAIGTAVSYTRIGDLLTQNFVIAQGESGVGVYEKAEFVMPRLSFVSNVGYVNIVDADENYVYAGVGNAIKVIDIKTQKEIADIKVDDVWNFKVKGRTLYVASGENGVKVLDISDIKNPEQIAVIDTPGRARSIDVSADGKYIYVADDRDDLQIIKAE